MNIVPGITSKPQAEIILKADTNFHLDGDPDYDQLIGDSPNQPFIGVNYVYPNAPNYVSQVRIFRNSGALTTLGKIIEEGHQVHRIFRSSYAMGTEEACTFLITFDENEQIVAVVDAFLNLDSSSSVSDIYVIGGLYQSDTFQNIRIRLHGKDEIRWIGFTSVLRYRAEVAIH